MSTRDPLLIAVAVWFDRLIVWLTLVGMLFCLLWEALWVRCLDGSSNDAVSQLQAVLQNRAAPVVTVLCVLTATTSFTAASTLAVWLHSQWRKQADLRTAHIRGSRLDQ